MSPKLLASALACAAVAISVPAQAAMIDLEEVVALSRAGVPDDVIIKRMQDEGATFDLTTREVIDLVDAGVSDAVVDYMLSTAPMRTEPPAPEPPPAPGEEVVEGVRDIVDMHEGGATEAELIAAIERSPPLRLTPGDLDVLRAVGVPEPALVAAVKRGLSAPRPARPARPARRATRTRPPPPRRRPPPRPVVERKRGFQLIGGLGLNTCVADEAADCTNADAGLAFNASAGYRANQWFSVALDFGYGSFSVPGDVSTYALSVQPTLRAHIPAGPVEFHLGAGLGYTSFVLASDDEETLTWSSPLSVKFTTGVTASLSRKVGLGVGLDFFVHPDHGEICVTFHDDFDDEVCASSAEFEELDIDIVERFAITFMVIFVL